MDWTDLTFAGAALLYFLGTVLFAMGMAGRRDALKHIACRLAVAGFLLHTVALGLSLWAHSLEELSKGHYLQILSWSVLLVFFLVWWKLRLEFLALTSSPLALLLLLYSLPLAKVRGELPETLSGVFFGLHIGSLFLALGFLAMAFGAGIFFIHLERKIKNKEKLTGFQKDMPALSVFDKVNHVAVAVGFPLFTLGLATGFAWAGSAWGRTVSGDPKEIVSVAIWFIFALLFHQRLAMGWRGRKPALLAVGVFLLAVASMVVVNYFLPTHHSFQS